MNNAAELLLSIRQGHAARPAALPATLAPQTAVEAYAIQQQVFALAGVTTGGWKASMPDSSSGFSAPIPAHNILRDGAPLRAPALVTANNQRFGIESEIAFTMCRTLAAGRHYSRAEVLDAVALVHAAIEICVCRLRDFDAAPPLDRLADHIMNEALVLSAPTNAWAAEALPQTALEVRVDGAVTHRGVGGHPLGDPVTPLVWMANHLSDRGIALAAGHVITTGSCNGIHYVPAGTHVEVEFAGLGVARIQL